MSEDPISGWTLNTASCSPISGNSYFYVKITSGQTTTCTFNNTTSGTTTTGTLTVIKSTTGGDGTFTFTGNTGINSITTVSGSVGQQTVSLAPGTYNIAEVVPAGWTLVSSSCTNGTPSAINIVSGQTTTCTFNDTFGGSKIPTCYDINSAPYNTTGFSKNLGDYYFKLTGKANAGAGWGGGSGTPYTSDSALAAMSVHSGAVADGETAIVKVTALGDNSPYTGSTQNGVTTHNYFSWPSSYNVSLYQSCSPTSSNGTLTVIKNTTGGNGTFTFTGNTGITSLTTVSSTISQSISLAAGTGIYNIAETVP